MAILAIISYFYYFQVSAFEAFSLRLQTVKQMQSGEEGSAAGCVIFWQDQIENAFESPLIGKVFNLRSLCISEFFIAYFIASLITAEIY
ncbi:MAG: hypothetical protein ISS28_03745, partial [Candidatus Cloacimonetes bacterium]|nr:hypothetical protein [Candidatus Cloacimonadota bacterium]